jgi:hypothetical protein
VKIVTVFSLEVTRTSIKLIAVSAAAINFLAQFKMLFFCVNVLGRKLRRLFFYHVITAERKLLFEIIWFSIPARNFRRSNDL